MNVLVALTLAAAPCLVASHSYVWWPTSREALQPSPRGPFSFNKPMFGELLQSKHGKGQGGAGGAKTAGSFSKFLCNKIPQAAAPVAEYKEGGEIRVVIPVNGEHGGEYDFRLCTKPWNKLAEGLEQAQCLDEHLIHRQCVEKPCSCSSDRCRGAQNVDQSSAIYETARKAGADKTPLHQDASIQGGHEVVFNLPAGVTCDMCTMQWFWHTAWGEEFAGCSDIKIAGAGGGGEGGGGEEPKTRRRRKDTKTRRRSATRRRTKTRRRTATRRRTKTRRRSTKTRRRSGSTVNSVHNAQVAHPYLADISSQRMGCFAHRIWHGYSPVEGPRDTFCFDTPPQYFGPERPCRGGLPFFRTIVAEEGSLEQCFKFCTNKGLDLFGITQDTGIEKRTECRCGASIENEDVWGTYEASAKRRGLMLTSKPIEDEECKGSEGIEVYQYQKWKDMPQSTGTAQLLDKRSQEDVEYMNRIIRGADP